MILTIKKSELLGKLRAARKTEIARVEKLNATIDSDFERERKRLTEEVEAALHKIQNTASGVDVYNVMRHSGGFSKRDKTEANVAEFDHAIYLLEQAKENEVRIDTERDKFGIAGAVRKALGFYK